MSTPPEAPQAPEAPQQSGGTEPPAGSDEAAAQSYFDEWSEAIERQIEELKQAVGHLANAQSAGVGSNAGHSASEPPTGAAQGQQGQAPAQANGGAGQPGGASAAGGTGSEQGPRSSHPYFKRLFGG